MNGLFDKAFNGFDGMNMEDRSDARKAKAIAGDGLVAFERIGRLLSRGDVEQAQEQIAKHLEEVVKLTK